MKMNSAATTLLITTALLATTALPALCEETYINVPGFTLHTDENHTSIQADGLALETNNHEAPSHETVIIQQPQQTHGQAIPRHRMAPQASYSNTNLNGMDFRGRNLQNVNFSNAEIEDSDFTGADLRGAIFSNAELKNVTFTGAQMVGAKFSNATFTNCNLNNADLSYADLANVDFIQTFAVGTRFDNAILSNVDMSGLIKKVAMPTVHVQPQQPVFVQAQTITQALKVDPRKPQQQRKIDLNINFDFNSDKLTPDGEQQTHEIALALSDPAFHDSRILIEGHTDNVGGDDYNLNLSYRRAMCIMRTLTQRYGISTGQLEAKGYGEARPIATNDSDFGRAKNRRVTIVNLGRI